MSSTSVRDLLSGIQTESDEAVFIAGNPNIVWLRSCFGSLLQLRNLHDAHSLLVLPRSELNEQI